MRTRVTHFKSPMVLRFFHSRTLCLLLDGAELRLSRLSQGWWIISRHISDICLARKARYLPWLGDMFIDLDRILWYIHLVGGLVAIFSQKYWVSIIIPIDFHSNLFQDGVAEPPTSHGCCMTHRLTAWSESWSPDFIRTCWTGIIISAFVTHMISTKNE